ncbi:MAG: CCA tRNA nucleotidyltransferase [Pseudomonadota bacterium]
MDRTADILIPPETSWLADPDSQAVCAVLTRAGFRALFVGGCVRNALLGRADSDIDIATDALPEKVMDLAAAAGLKAVPTGIDHGTVTVVAGGKPFEITTFRRDVETDGRRAVVAFSTDIAEDARRRDFTMNALYATPDGRVVDPLGGLPDLHARRIRFIENADARIKEDYLRTLRFFRFFAWYGDAQAGFDAEALDAITQNLRGLETLSAERVGAEMRKFLAAPDPAFALAGMRQTGALGVILPGADDRLVGLVVDFEERLGLHPDWQTRLLALGGQDVVRRLRLSRAEAKALQTLMDALEQMTSAEEVAYRHGQDAGVSLLLMRAALAEAPPDADALDGLRRAAEAIFPVKAADLMPVFEGPALGAQLATLERAWIASRFTASKEDLLSRL